MHRIDGEHRTRKRGAYTGTTAAEIEAVWRVTPHRSSFSRADVTGTLGRALVVSLVTHVMLASLMGAPHAGDVPATRSARASALHARLQVPPRPASESPAALVAQMPSQPDVPDTASRPPSMPSAPVVQQPESGAVPEVIAPSGVIAAPVTARYYLPREVDQPSEPLEHAQLLYPEEALKQRIGGVVVMHLFIGADGALERTEVVHAEPPGVFEQAVRDAAHASRFRPAMLGRASVNSRKYRCRLIWRRGGYRALWRHRQNRNSPR